jgi:hypothetical protein
MRTRAVAAVCAGALLLGGCGADVVGPGIPECADDAAGDIATATIIPLQALPDSSWGPCIRDLKVGWSYVTQFVESGRTIFWIDSDRVGDEFLEVELTGSCWPQGVDAVGPHPEIDRTVDVVEEPTAVRVPVVPVAPRHVEYARDLVFQMFQAPLRGREIDGVVDDAEASASARVEQALRADGVVLVVDDREAASGTVELLRVGHEAKVGISLQEALEEIEDDLGPPAYRATWYHTFAGGCVVYRFDAEGAGAEDVADDVSNALGFYPLGRLREAARRAGYDV